MFTVVSRKLSKKLACRTEQNMSTKDKKMFSCKVRNVYSRTSNKLSPILSKCTVAMPIAMRNMLRQERQNLILRKRGHNFAIRGCAPPGETSYNLLVTS